MPRSCLAACTTTPEQPEDTTAGMPETTVPEQTTEAETEETVPDTGYPIDFSQKGQLRPQL